MAKRKKIELTEVAVSNATGFTFLNGRNGKTFNLGKFSDNHQECLNYAKNLAEFLEVPLFKMEY